MSQADRLAAVARQAMLSAALQASRAAAFGGEAHAHRLQVRAIRASFFWRVTTPLRWGLDLLRGGPGAYPVRRAVALVRERGLRHALERGRAWQAMRRRAAAEAAPEHAPPPAMLAAYEGAPAGDPARLLSPRVLIVGELTLPQCAKYRVWQKQELLATLGIPCTVLDWRDTDAVLAQACFATEVVLYRVPYFPEVQRMVAGLRRCNLRLAFEVDDLIFDRELFLHNRNLDTLDPELREGVVSGVDLYRACMLACDWGIASTEALAEAMRGAGLADVAVIENALDAETLATAERARRPPRMAGDVVMVYGSGTKTHNADFAVATPALLSVLRAHPEARLRIVGELQIDPAFDAFGARVERLPPMPYTQYLAALAEADISLAPLEPTIFNDAKSNIKFLEAAIVGRPSVCSPRANFRSVIRQGEDGMLAESEAEWREALTALITDPALRARLGDAARETALARYAPEAVARGQVAPRFVASPPRPAGLLRVLLANIYYWPRSYGGATIVVEELARRLAARDDTEVSIATGLDNAVKPPAARRYLHEGIPVFALPVSEGADAIGEFDNPLAGAAFGAVLDAMRPDVVHLHSVQWISASAALACLARDIPYVITLHDCWWLCARQFMVTGEETYCGQTRIDLAVCEACIPGAKHLRQRADLLRQALDGAALLIAPSEAHRALHLAQGIAPERIAVLPNGVRLPAAPRQAAARPRLRFGYVGGAVAVKGYPLVRAAFEALPRGDWDLVLVDNTRALGFSTIDARLWRVRGRVEVVPPYTQETIDDFFAGIDVLLFPSQWKESFGLTVREALARDVWVVTTAGGGPAEAVTEGVNGTILPLDGSAAALTGAIAALLDRAETLRGFRNPLKFRITDYAAQADALHGILADVAQRHHAAREG